MDRLKESQFAKLLHEYVDTYVKYKVADNDEKIMHWFLLSDESKELFLYFGKLQNDNDTLQARIAELEAAQRQNWTPVSERLPETDGQYIGYTNTGLVGTHWLVDGHFVVTYSCEQNWLTTPTSWILESASGGDVYVTHWMPLPEPPIVYGKVCE